MLIIKNQEPIKDFIKKHGFDEYSYQQLSDLIDDFFITGTWSAKRRRNWKLIRLRLFEGFTYRKLSDIFHMSEPNSFLIVKTIGRKLNLFLVNKNNQYFMDK